MHPIFTVFKSEFLRRVTSVWFVVATLVVPVILLGVMLLPAVLGTIATSSDERTVAVVDETGVLFSRLAARYEAGLRLAPVEAPLDDLRAAVEAGSYDGVLVLPATLLEGEGEARFYSAEGTGLSFGARLEALVDGAVEAQRLEARNASPEVLAILTEDVPVRFVKFTEEGEAADSSQASSLIGLIMGFFIYTAMFIYGAYVLHGVMEEKQSRVVEVMISSVRPFQLLMGKVLGIGLMGLVQMTVWALGLVGLTLYAGPFVALLLDPAELDLPSTASQEELLRAADFSLPQLAPELFVWFLLFFIGGYLLYASLYAAIGAAVESQQDAQSLMIPIALLIVIPITCVTFLVESPNSTFSVVLSLIPFFSPILMVVRIAVTDVPTWQLLLSYLLLIAGFVQTIWLSSRIYRVGILMYGKKPTLKDLVKWVRYA